MFCSGTHSLPSAEAANFTFLHRLNSFLRWGIAFLAFGGAKDRQNSSGLSVSLGPGQDPSVSNQLSLSLGLQCNASVDLIGTCWPRSPAGQLVVRPCPAFFYGVRYNTTSKEEGRGWAAGG